MQAVSSPALPLLMAVELVLCTLYVNLKFLVIIRLGLGKYAFFDGCRICIMYNGASI